MKLDIQPANGEIAKALKSISTFDGKTRIKIENAVNNTVRAMARLAKQKVPRRTGRLEDSVFSSFRKGECVGYFGARRQNAHLIEGGVKASVVKPKKKNGKKVLRFYPYYVGAPVYRRRMNIPARPARPFVKPAYDDELPRLFNRLRKALNEK